MRGGAAGVAQLAERNLAKVEVASSNLVSRSAFVFARRRDGRVVYATACKAVHAGSIPTPASVLLTMPRSLFPPLAPPIKDGGGVVPRNGEGVVPRNGGIIRSFLENGFAAWAGVVVFALLLLALRGRAEWIAEYPPEWTLPVAPALNAAMEWFVAATKPFFRAAAAALELPLKGAREFLNWLPWPAALALVCALAHRAGGWKLTAFAAASLLYILAIGYWRESMNSLALVCISVPLAVCFGFALGAWGFASRRAERALSPVLDVLQTVPAFAYLLPILLLFGFGAVVGLIASLLYSFPPMVRNTIVGLRAVPGEVIDAGLISGATRRQLFWRVRVPTALPQLLLGVNQTTMASLSMVIVASIIGGTDDIGWEVLSTMRKAQFGESLLAGIVIALMAMLLDRITCGLATRRDIATAEKPGALFRNRYWIVAALAACFAFAARFLPELGEYPKEWVVRPAGALNEMVRWMTAEFQPAINAIKSGVLFFFMLPLRIGLERTVTPFSWGFAPTIAHAAGYAIFVCVVCGWLLHRRKPNAAAACALLGIVFYAGLTKTPWPALLAVLALWTLRLGGLRLALGALAAAVFLLFCGVWGKVLLSLYLCGVAVAAAFFGGTLLGVCAAHNDWFSRLMRPVNDTLQTMPLFVILIPIVMFFKIGEFTALLAIIAYAYIPAFRYAEHGVRAVPADVLEAGRAMGCTTAQLLWRIKLPLSLPNIMLGLNQTIMYAVAMLVIAALVGTNGLGQQVYIGLSKGDFGIGIIAGAGMAMIAIVADRMCKAWRGRVVV